MFWIFFFFFLFLLFFILYGIFLCGYYLFGFFLAIFEGGLVFLLGFLCLLGLIFYQYFFVILGFYNFLFFDGLVIFVQLILTTFVIFFFFINWKVLDFFSIINLEFYFLLIFCSFGVYVLSLAYDSIFLYLGLELVGLSLYVLSALKRNSEFSVEAGLKYFILGSLASVFFLVGVSSIFGFFGTMSFEDFSKLFLGFFYEKMFFFDFFLILSFFFIVIGFLFKIGAAPFHVWLPDVYEGSPFVILCFFSLVPKYIIFIVNIRLFCFCLSSFLYNFIYIIFSLSAFFSVFFGILGAFVQFKFKRFLAYSSIVNTGFILFGFVSTSFGGFQSILLYIYIYLYTLLGVFSIFLQMHFNFGKNWYVVQCYFDYANLFTQHPVFGFFCSVFFFSFAGIPPLGGFFGKFYILLSLSSVGLMGWCSFILIATFFASFYYLRIVYVIFFYFDDCFFNNYSFIYLNNLICSMSGAFVIFVGLFLGFFLQVFLIQLFSFVFFGYIFV